MRALAEFVMRGRFQAALVAAAGNLVPLLSTAVVGLVALRRGMADGMLILFWAILPVVVIAAASSGVNLLLMSATAAALWVVLLAAQVLKLTASWSKTLLACLLGSGLSIVLISYYFPGQIDELQQALDAFFKEMALQAGQGTEQLATTRSMLLGVIAYVTLLNVVVSLLISRWWQAMLYNPGGFRTEMHQFRLEMYPAILLMLGVAGCYLAQPDYTSWASFLGLPLLLGGLCLVHYVVAASAMGGHWLVMMYLAILLFGPFTLVLMAVGFADSVLNLRSRIVQKNDS